VLISQQPAPHEEKALNFTTIMAALRTFRASLAERESRLGLTLTAGAVKGSVIARPSGLSLASLLVAEVLEPVAPAILLDFARSRDHSPPRA
jgi:hypothetical protein